MFMLLSFFKLMYVQKVEIYYVSRKECLFCIVILYLCFFSSFVLPNVFLWIIFVVYLKNNDFVVVAACFFVFRTF